MRQHSAALDGDRRFGSIDGPPVSPQARMLLRRADSLLEEAAGATDPAERFLAAYIAALRGAGALLAAVDPAPKRGRSRSAWVRIGSSAPDLAEWSAYFAGWSSVRASVEAGSVDRMTEKDADAFFVQVGRFLHAVDDRIHQSEMPVSMSA
ncbi:SAV_6107 family HEPN domain-containing protein [Actinomycetes bacterium M1A6_2h]